MSQDIPTFKGYAWLSVFHVPRQSGHSGQCGKNSPKPGPDIPAHDTYWLDWESVRDTPEQVKAYAQEWHDGDDFGYIVAVEVTPTIVERVKLSEDDCEPASAQRDLFA